MSEPIDFTVPIKLHHEFDLGNGWSVTPSVTASEELTTVKPFAHEPEVSAVGVQFAFKF